jgi:hypothetical protein
MRSSSVDVACAAAAAVLMLLLGTMARGAELQGVLVAAAPEDAVLLAKLPARGGLERSNPADVAPVFLEEKGLREAPEAQSALAWSFVVENSFASKYVSRGVRNSDGPAWQPAASASCLGFTAFAWANMDLSDDGGARNRFTEIDLGIEYARSFGDVNLLAGYVNYQYPNIATPTSSEIYGGVGYKCWFNPMLTLYQDIDQSRGQYVSLTTEHAFEKVWEAGKDVSVDIVLTAGAAYGSADYNRVNYGTDTAGFTDAVFTIAAPIHLGGKLTLTPSISGSQLLSSSIRNSMAGGSSSVWGMLTLSYKF